jgi:hypothetical protein
MTYPRRSIRPSLSPRPISRVPTDGGILSVSPGSPGLFSCPVSRPLTGHFTGRVLWGQPGSGAVAAGAVGPRLAFFARCCRYWLTRPLGEFEVSRSGVV